MLFLFGFSSVFGNCTYTYSIKLAQKTGKNTKKGNKDGEMSNSKIWPQNVENFANNRGSSREGLKRSFMSINEI